MVQSLFFLDAAGVSIYTKKPAEFYPKGRMILSALLTILTAYA